MNLQQIQYQLVPLGDRAVVLDFGGLPFERAWDAVRQATAALEQEPLAWVTDLVPAYNRLTLHFDPVLLSACAYAYAFDRNEHGSLANRLKQGAVDGSLALGDRQGARARSMRRLRTDDGDWAAYLAAYLAAELSVRMKTVIDAPAVPSRLVELPVCYGGEYGPDLEDASAAIGLQPEELVRLHTSTDYSVVMIGFMPGFPYLAGLSERLVMPRRSVPRQRVEAGSVGIAGTQTGVYPIATPGGWQLIGRTPVRLFRPEREPAALLAAGDIVRFRSIPPEAFADWADRTDGADAVDRADAADGPEAGS